MMKGLLLLVLAAVSGGSSALLADTATASAQAPQAWESGHFSLVPRAFQRDPHLDLSIVTEVSNEGKALPTPSAEHPTYFLGIDSGEIDKGDPIAGEQPPKPEVLRTAMLQALRVNGYLPASKEHRPTQVIQFMWGSYNKLTFKGGGRTDPIKLQNLAARAAIVGGDQFSHDMIDAYVQGGIIYQTFKLKDPRYEWLTDLARSNLYYIMASSFEYEAATKHQIKYLWRTKMSTNSNGISMDESVPTLVANSGAYFGKPTAGPARLDRPAIKNGHVEIGTPTVKSYGDPAPSASH